MKKWTAFTCFLFLVLSIRPAFASTDLVKRWEFQISGVLDQNLSRTAPVADADGNVYAASRTQIVSVDYYGNKRWEVTSGAIYPQMRIASDKLIFVSGDLGGKVTALNKDTGAKIWETVLNPDYFINIPISPKIIGDKVYITYEHNNVGQSYFDAINLADGKRSKEVMLNSSSLGLLRSDLIVPNLASSKPRLYGVGNYNVLFSISPVQLLTYYENTGLINPTKILAISDEDTSVAVASNNNLAFIGVTSDGYLSTAQKLALVNVTTAVNSLGLFSGDQFFVNTLSSSATPAAIVAVSKTQNKELWRRNLPFGVQNQPVITDQNQIAVVADNLYLQSALGGSLIQTIALGNTNRDNFSGAVSSGPFIYILTKDGKLTAFGPPQPHHPVILIHGLGGNPSDWEDGGNKDGLKKRLLEKYRTDQPDYPDSWIVPYSYTGVDKKTGGYNSEGRVEDITLGMDNAIATLSAQLKSKGGDGMVDIVGYSMGGLVLREYLATHPNFENVRKCIAVGSPNEGSFFADVEKDIRTASQNVHKEELLQKTLDDVLKMANYHLDLESEGINYLFTDSKYLSELKSRHLYKNPLYDSIASDFSIQFQMRFMYAVVSATPIDVGDMVISKESATNVFPIVPNNTWIYRQNLPVPLTFINIAPVPGITINVPRIAELEFFHPYMMKSENLQQQIVDELYGIPEDDIRRV